jgi:hypothetical protein
MEFSIATGKFHRWQMVGGMPEVGGWKLLMLTSLRASVNGRQCRAAIETGKRAD